MLVYLIAYYVTARCVRVDNSLLKHVLITGCDGLILSIGAWYLRRAIVNKEKRVMWSVFLASTVGLTVVDEIAKEPLLLGQFAWVALFLIFLHSYGYLKYIWLKIRGPFQR